MADHEIIEPKPLTRDKLRREGINLQTRLVTTGQIKSELGKIFREVRSKKLDPDIARTCAGILRIMLKATEQEHMFQLAADDPDSDTPSLTGVTIIGPGFDDVRKLTGPSTGSSTGKKGKGK